MNIIFGDKHADELRDKFILLELDTFVSDSGLRQTAYCVVENIPLDDFPVIESYVKVHHDLLRAYRDQNWEYCRNAIQGLHGKWNGELDSFYADLAARVMQYEDAPPGDNWDGGRSVQDLGLVSTI